MEQESGCPCLLFVWIGICPILDTFGLPPHHTCLAASGYDIKSCLVLGAVGLLPPFVLLPPLVGAGSP